MIFPSPIMTQLAEGFLRINSTVRVKQEFSYFKRFPLTVSWTQIMYQFEFLIFKCLINSIVIIVIVEL